MIYTIIPHYGNDAMLNNCIESVKRQSIAARIPIRLCVINNNPPNPNRLFTGAINEGLSEAMRSCGIDDWDVFWVLNNDAIADEHCASAALKRMAAEERCGIIGCRNVHPCDPDQIVWGGSGAFIPAGVHKTGKISKGELAYPSDELWATFSSVFISAGVVREIGILDSRMKHICSDADYCIRARWAGWRVIHEPSSFVYHAHASSAKPSEAIAQQMDRDSKLMQWKWKLGWFSLPNPSLPPEPDAIPRVF